MQKNNEKRESINLRFIYNYHLSFNCKIMNNYLRSLIDASHVFKHGRKKNIFIREIRLIFYYLPNNKRMHVKTQSIEYITRLLRINDKNPRWFLFLYNDLSTGFARACLIASNHASSHAKCLNPVASPTYNHDMRVTPSACSLPPVSTSSFFLSFFFCTSAHPLGIANPRTRIRGRKLLDDAEVTRPKSHIHGRTSVSNDTISSDST